jgi:hypothetical protein
MADNRPYCQNNQPKIREAHRFNPITRLSIKDVRFAPAPDGGGQVLTVESVLP